MLAGFRARRYDFLASGVKQQKEGRNLYGLQEKRWILQIFQQKGPVE
jgi:hypothetical protein